MSQYRKFFAAATAFIGAIVAAGVLPDEWAAWAAAVLAGLGAAGVFLFPNADRPGTEPEYTELDDDAADESGSFTLDDGRPSAEV